MISDKDAIKLYLVVNWVFCYVWLILLIVAVSLIVRLSVLFDLKRDADCLLIRSIFYVCCNCIRDKCISPNNLNLILS